MSEPVVVPLSTLRPGRNTPKGRMVDPKAREEVARVLGDARRERDELIENMHRLQDSVGYLSAPHLAALAEAMKLALAEVYEVATFYHHFDVVKEGESPPPEITVRVCESLSCQLAGAGKLLAELQPVGNALRGVPSGLRVSARSAEEARAALAGGASIIDVKEPNRGSLGAAEPAVWREVAAAVGRAVSLSAALGELTDEDRPDARMLGPEYQFAKLGLSGCAKLPDWQARWEEALACLPKAASRVAVVYADWRAAESPEPREVLDGAIALGCAALLVDTFDKSGGDLFCHLAAGELRQLTSAAREAGLLVVLAGSLSMETLAQALQFSPDFVAVRGAVCRGSRRGPVEETLVREAVAGMNLTIHSPTRQFA